MPSDAGLPEQRARGIRSFAEALWSSDYVPYLRLEELGCVEVYNALPQSTYRRRLKGEAAEKYDAKALSRVTSAHHQLVRSVNQEAWSFKTVARSLSYLNQRVPKRVWLDNMRDRRLAHWKGCTQVLREMVRVQPAVVWTAHPNVFVMAADATFSWRGCKKRGGGHRGAGAR